jgi:hypothetical protein
MTATIIRDISKQPLSAEKPNSDNKKRKTSLYVSRYAHPPRFDTESYFYYTEVFKNWIDEED